MRSTGKPRPFPLPRPQLRALPDGGASAAGGPGGVVTGAAGTIGREVCRVLGDAGALLAVTEVDDAGLGALCTELSALT